MVKRNIFLITLSVIFALMPFVDTAFAAWKGTYHIEQEWVKIWINQDGTIDLFYNITMKLDSGDNINYVYIGQPKPGFRIDDTTDQYGNTLETVDESHGEHYRVKVTLHTPLEVGQSVWFTLTTTVPHMIWEDTQNTGNVGMQFIPTWWEEASVFDLRVSIVLPLKVKESMVKTTEVYWNNTRYDGERLSIYWEKQNLSPDEKYPVGVSFPKEYVETYDVQPTGLVAFLQQYGPTFLILGVSVGVIGAVVYVARKRPYLTPMISMETLGIRHGLTAVEASYLLDVKPTKVVTEILYSLLHKRAVWVESATPTLELKIMQPFQDKTGTPKMPLRYYEKDFLNAIKADGTLDEEKLAQTIMSLRDTIEEKLHGYCRRDTVDYYRKVVAKAWQQVEQAGTAELASKAYDEQLLWLFLDPNYQSRTQTAFRDKTFEPSPFWLWYWYGYRHYHAKPTYEPNIEAPTKAAKPPTIPGADFANNIATAVEGTSNKIVTDLEKFADAIVPTPAAKSSTQPAHHGSSCVCACAACACACACVSCACACAGGGVG